MSLLLRPARTTDAGTLGGILSDFAARAPWMPELHTGAETIAFCGRMIDAGWVTVAEETGVPRGFLAREGSFVHALYLAPGATGRGIGRALLDAAKAESAELRLRSFEANMAALRFYLREDFRKVGAGCGRDNDEDLPDVELLWRREEDRP
ncbi:MAG: N-acetyltransferase family protein [Paracoccaceae bacterium]